MQNLKPANIFGLFAIVFIAVGLPSFCNAATMDKDIAESYMKADYSTTAKLFERQIEVLTEKSSKGEKVNFSDLYRRHLLLAHIYAWKLNKFDEALSEYQKISELRESYKEVERFPPLEFMYLAEIYERKNDLSRTKGYYEDLLKALIALQEKENDDVSIIMAEDFIKFIKYHIDGLSLKSHPKKDFKPLLGRLKLSGQAFYTAVTQLFAFAFVPAAEYEFSIAQKTDVPTYIKQSQLNLSSSILNYVLVLNVSSGSVNELSEKALEAYLSKYSESYHAIMLRYMFYKYYMESGQPKKGKRLLKELDEIATKRGIELITGPDKSFATPEETWKTYKKALIEGNLEEAMECYAPGRQRHKQVYNVLGKEKMKEIGKEMGDIIRVSGGEREAIYETLRKENGKEYSYEFRFYNIDGEWKMQEF